jgi:hypothetical protein
VRGTYGSSSDGAVKEIVDDGLVRFEVAENGDLVYMNGTKLYHINQESGKITQMADNTSSWMVLKDVLLYNSEDGVYYAKLGNPDKHRLTDDILVDRTYNVDAEGKHMRIAYMDNHIIYMDNSSFLWSTEFGSDKKEQLFDGVRRLYSTKKKLYFLSHEGSL